MISTASIRDEVQALRTGGFAVCKIDPVQKRPVFSEWTTKSLEASDFRDGESVGILAGWLSDGGKVGHALVIIDLDTPAAVEHADQFLPDTGMEEGRASPAPTAITSSRSIPSRSGRRTRRTNPRRRRSGRAGIPGRSPNRSNSGA